METHFFTIQFFVTSQIFQSISTNTPKPISRTIEKFIQPLILSHFKFLLLFFYLLDSVSLILLVMKLWLLILTFVCMSYIKCDESDSKQCLKANQVYHDPESADPLCGQGCKAGDVRKSK